VTTEPDLRAVADRQEIYQVLMRYCRGVDRGDPELLRSVYHEDAADHHGPLEFTDARTEFAAVVVPRLDAMAGVGQHHITNCLIELDADAASVESYWLAFQPTKSADGGEARNFMGGRYLDRFERRAGRWAIAERTVVIDWSRDELHGDEWAGAGDYLRPGRRESDPSHALFRRS
jgi:hypothetical protein